ncbi:MAG: serine hydrolase [Sphingomonas sp.]|uniref:serine hydrolase n=1 Tax=Sphingomonas sp. TaxID=28214 RepID=UPI001847C95B|nr:serine hydrolase [Sphingomonas sp.]MBA3666577.1 serine hydrolase [Sphingomonas sp.]
MRFTRLMLWLLVLMAQPASAQTLPSLQSLRQQLTAMVGASSGDVGIAALDLRSGELISVQGDEPFPMASTVKVAIAANYLAQVEAGRRSLSDTIRGRTASRLMEAMLIHSDNAATDILLRDLGGPRTIQHWLTQNELSGLRIDRSIAQLLSDRRDLRDVRDSSTPRAMVELLQRIDSGRLLRPASRSYLLGLMSRCMTGRNRIRGLLPMGTPVEHKTGTLTGYTSDVGFITMPDGRRIAVALFARGRDDRPRLIARAARVIYDGFAAAFRYPFGAAAFASP